LIFYTKNKEIFDVISSKLRESIPEQKFELPQKLIQKMPKKISVGKVLAIYFIAVIVFYIIIIVLLS